MDTAPEVAPPHEATPPAPPEAPKTIVVEGFVATVLADGKHAWAVVENDVEFVVDKITGAVKRAEAGFIAIFRHDGTVDAHPAHIAKALHPEIAQALEAEPKK